MAIIKGSVTVAESQRDLAYSEDDDVVAGPEREGCGWCPVEEFVRVGPKADVLTVRSMNEREYTRHRDHYAAGEASANVFVAKTTVVAVKTDGKKKKLEGRKALDWVSQLAIVVPTAIDLLARRQIQVSQLRDPHELYPEFRAELGYPSQPQPKHPDLPDEDSSEEVNRADGDSKSEPASGG